jgi:hypothetical protein
MSEIRSKPSSKQFRENFDRIFRKADRPRGEAVTGSLRESSHDENIDWGEFKTVIVVNNNPNFTGD